MKHLLRCRLLPALFLGLLTAAGALAQNPSSGGPTPGVQPPDPAAVPLDGGASLLLAGAVAYGLRRLRRRK